MIRSWIAEAEEYNRKLNRENIYYWYGPILLSNGEFSKECYHVYQKIYDVNNFMKISFPERMPISQIVEYFDKVKEEKGYGRN